MFNNENTVDGILSVFGKTVEKLQALATKKSEEANKLQDDAASLKYKSDVASFEAKKAKEAAERVSAMIKG